MLALGAASATRLVAQRGEQVAGTAHNLSVSGPGSVRALTETRICVFCHTPHNAAPATPLWNREDEGRTYDTYTSGTLRAAPLPQPSGPTKLCLSCHDGTVALGASLQPAEGIAMGGGGGLSAATADFGLDLSGHHPVSFAYHASLPNAELVSPPPGDLVYGAGDEVHCSTCHDPHDDRYGKFLVKDNRGSALCTTCHQLTGWAGSAHATSDASVAGLLPRPPKTWPTFTRLGDWGCESCHTPHQAPTAQGLLAFTDAPPDPFSCTSAGCHGGGGSAVRRPAGVPTPPRSGTRPGTRSGMRAGGADIAAALLLPSAHRPLPGSFVAAHDVPGGAGRTGVRGVTCADCHDPHQVVARPAEPPYLSGLVAGVSGVDRNGLEVAEATYEYEICFKCHADASGDAEVVPRVVSSTNVRLDFAGSNPSFHPVVASAPSAQVPSLGTTLMPALRSGDLIGCTSCHADSEGRSNGPHGSTWAPILRDRYDTADGSAESLESYALCYRCHDRNSILADQSFRPTALPTTPSGGGHSGHLQAGISCAACHDPHGVPAGQGDGSGAHSHLVNFDLRVAQPLPGTPYPVFEDRGTFAGSCSLVCHGVEHREASYR